MSGSQQPPVEPEPEPEPESASVAEEDVRVRRTRARLREAVLRLASERPVEEISVADLVRAARINRTTFYKHADSPAAVLERALYEDLDRLRAVWLADAATAGLPAEAVWNHASDALLDHLERYDALYTVGLTGHRSAVLYRLLADHFAASVQALFDRRPAGPPPGHGPDAWRSAAYSAYTAHGEVGLVEAWLALPRPRERQLFASAALALLPDWLVRAEREPG